MRRPVLFLAAMAAMAGAPALAAPLPPPVAAAAADPARAADKATDARRHGPELMAFAGVKRGDKVLELIPGAGYFTHLFSRIVGPDGHVYAIWPKPYADEAQPDVAALQAAAGWTITEMLPQPVDVVFTSQNYHDYPDKFMGRIDPMVLNREVFKALKPGGVYVIVDHAAEPGSGMRDTDTLHRIDEAIVRKQVQAAGFVFARESRLLRNPADTHKLLVFKPEIRGKTDQFVLKFRKP